MTIEKLLLEGISAWKSGDSTRAASLLAQVVQADPRSAEGWYWLGKSLSSSDKKIYCFRWVLKISPDHNEAREELELIGYLKPETPRITPPSIFEPVPTSTLFPETETTFPLSAKPDSSVFQKGNEEEPGPDKKLPYFFEEPVDKENLAGDVDDSEEKNFSKPGKNIKRGQKVLLVILGIIAVFSIAGVFTFYLMQTELMDEINLPILPSPVTPYSSTTTLPTLISTATPLPFSALDAKDYLSAFEPSECSFEIPEGTNVDCGFVIVPENRYGDVDKRIRLAVAIYRGTDNSATPVIYLQGGPGQEAIEFMSKYFYWTIAPFVAERDFILLDQRGMGLSEPNLDCPKLDEIYEADAADEISLESREGQYLAAFEDCRDRLVSQGVHLSSYNTMENAADVKDVILTLGYEEAILFGVSYGTRLAQVVMRENPEVVSAAVLDSVLPIEGRVFNESAKIAQASLETLFAGCAASSKCRLAYPDLEDDLRVLVNQLQEKPLYTSIFGYGEDDYSHSVNGVEFMSTILWAMRDPDLQGVIPQAIERAKAGETNMLGFILSFPVNAVNDINLGSYLSINCREQVYASTPKEVGDDLASYPDTEAIGLSWVYGDPNFIFDLCDTWQVEGIRPNENDAVSGDIPTLVMAGEYDSTTPPFWAEQVSARLSRSIYVEFPGQGHGVAFSQNSVCPQKILQSFLANPEMVPDTSCAADMPSPEFSVPYEGEPPLNLIPIASELSGIVTVAPLSWTRDGDSAVFRRESSTWDMTSVSAMQVGLDFDTLMGIIVGDFEGIGLDSFPHIVGEVEANGLKWELYKTSLIALPVDIAYTQSGYDAILVLLLSHADEHEILYEEVFLEMLNSTNVFVAEEVLE